MNGSLSKPILVCTLLLVAATAWGLYQDAWGLRPWKRYSPALRQIYVADAGIVDRCESCHVKIRQNHPNGELLRIHDPDRFGCTFCHNGNGAATTSVAKAHGLNRDWPWPLLDKKSAEAGCVACHPSDRVLDQAPVLETARELYNRKGCAACHRHQEFDLDTDAMAAMNAEIRSLDKDQERDRVGIQRETDAGDNAASNDEARRHYAAVEDLRRGISSRDGRIADLADQVRDMRENRKGSGPNLKDTRLKMRKEWIPAWLKDPEAFRPGTRMPVFRLTDEEVREISAFIWQAAVERPMPAQPMGDAGHGKELFESRGCLGCHSMNGVGNRFAAELARLGEKSNYEYVARWVHDPSEVGETGDPRPVMPSMRLSWEESRDIAAYLTGLRKPDAAYPHDVSFMDDRQLAEKGRKLAVFYGCPNCHLIRGLEKTQRIGTDLTYEGSKPLEQLDFALLETDARRGGWYTPQDFFERKMREPGAFDSGQGKKPEDRLHMPRVILSDEERRSLVTYLLGSVEAPEGNAFRTIPAAYRYRPADAAKDIQDGWWVIKRYNCMGCHAMRAGQKSSLAALPQFQDPDALELMPPPLHQEGARVNPRWLEHFLGDPGAAAVRSYLPIRMPTFPFSRREIRTLVKFFSALSGEREPWVPAPLAPLTDRERQLARAIFSSRDAPCLKCHLTGEALHDKTATAPNFLTAGARLKPGWTGRWMTDPQNASPGTAMPSNLFRRKGDRWVLAGSLPSGFADMRVDQVDLLVRYLFQLDAQEQRRLMTAMPAAGGR
jgi:cytochrome c1